MANRVMLIGRVATDPELKYTPSGIAVVNFRIAVDRPFQGPGGEREADFFTVKVWREQAERVANYLAKGQLVVVDGRLEYRTWDAPDGAKRSATEVIANVVSFQDNVQMMFTVIATANQIVSESLRLLNRIPNAEGGAPRENDGFSDRPASPPQPAGRGFNEQPAGRSFGGGGQSGAGPSGGGPAGRGGMSNAQQEEPDFGDPFADQ